MVAALRFLDPEIAEWTLLILGTSDEFFECFVCLVRVSAYLEFFACLPNMIRGFACQAISFLAHVTSEIIAINFGIKYKPVVAVCTGAPRNILLKAHLLLHGILFVLVHLLYSENFVHIMRGQNSLHSGIGQISGHLELPISALR